MKKTIFWIFVLIGFLLLVVRYASIPIDYFFKVEKKAGIRVLSVPEGADVYVNGNLVGQTPYETSDLKEGNYQVKLLLDTLNWQGNVKIDGGTKAIVNRDLAEDVASSAGELLTLEPGSGVTIVSQVSNAEVEIDGKSYGKTPLIATEVTPGEHTFVLSHSSYLKRSIRARVQEGFNLNLNVDLALSEADLSTIVTPVTTATAKLVVKSTPTGFLRVRERANLTSKEVGRVNPKTTLVMLEELSGWYRVRLEDGQEGYVSAEYVEKAQ